MVTISKVNARAVFLPAVLGLAIGLLVAGGHALGLGLLSGVVLLPLLLRKPEISLAILFNGTVLFFYLLYKMGYEPSRLMTGAFHSYLAVSYVLPAELLLTKRRPLRFDSLDVLFACFFFWFFVSYAISATGNEAAYIKVTYAPLLVLAPYLGVRVLASEARLRKFFDYCVLAGIVAILPAYYELFRGHVFAGNARFAMYTFGEGGGNPIAFGIVFAILVLFAFVRMLEDRRHGGRYAVVALASAYLVLRSGSRGALLSLLVTVAFYVVFLAKMKPSVRIAVIVAVVSLVAIGFMALPKSTTQFYQYSLSTEARTEEASSVYRRLRFWQQALDDFKRSPITGVGTGNSVGGSGFPHNILLEVLAEHGLVGFVLFGGMCFLTLRKAMVFLKYEKSRELILTGRLSLLLFVYFLAEAMFSGYITRQVQLFMSMALIASLPGLKLSARLSQGSEICPGDVENARWSVSCFSHA